MNATYTPFRNAGWILIFLLLPWWSGRQAWAQPYCPINYYTGSFDGDEGLPYDIAAGDFNRDGKLDLVTPNAVSNTVGVLLSNGQGGFSPMVHYPGGSTPWSVAVADFNGDGLLDLVTANQGASQVSILLGNGAGGFGSKIDYPTQSGSTKVVVGDFNGDGKPDLATRNDNSTVSVLLNNGTGAFSTRHDITVGTYRSGLAVGDFNRDGKLDLAVGESLSSAGVYVLLGDGRGDFGPKTYYTVGERPTSVAVADFNGDGKPDLVTAGYGTNAYPGHSVSVLLGDGVGGFGTKTDYLVGGRPNFVLVKDFNGDGKPDIIALNSADQSVSVLLGNGAGGFGVGPTIPLKGEDANRGVAAHGLVIEDINGNGKLDLATADWGSRERQRSVLVMLRCTNPLMTLYASASTGNVCVNESYNLSVQVTGGTPPYSYSWEAPAGVTLTGPTNMATVTAIFTKYGTIDTRVTAIVKDAEGISVSARTGVVLVGHRSDVTISASPSALSCSQTSLTLTAQATYTEDGITKYSGGNWKWNGPGIVSLGYKTALVNKEGTYSFVFTASGCSDTATIDVSRNSTISEAGIVASGILSCNNPTVTLTASPAGQASYVFSEGASQIGGSSGNTATVSAGGTYSVMITSVDGCTTSVETTVTGDATNGLTTYYADTDGDGFGNLNSPTSVCASTPPAGYVTNSTDCDDSDATVNTSRTYYADADGDGFGNLNSSTNVCTSIPPTGYVTNSTDCDDTRKLYTDADGDGFGAGPAVACGVASNTDCNDGDATMHESQDATFTGLASTYCSDAGAVTLTPTISGGTFSGPGISGTTFTPANAGSGGTIVYTLASGCTTSSSQSVIVNPIPAVPTLSASPATTTTTTTFTVTAAGCAGSLSWTPTGGTGTSNGNQYTFSAPGNYSLTATCTVNGCTSPASSSVSLTINAAPVGFSIASVTGVSCSPIQPNKYSVSFTPVYQGTDGSTITFRVRNESLPTTAPGPYTLQLYTDNPTIILEATQATGDQATYRFDWQAACAGGSSPNRAPTTTGIPNQTIPQNQAYKLDLSAYFSDPDGQALTYSATGLPAGLSVSGSSITGTPTTAGTSTVLLSARDLGNLTATTSFTLNVTATPPPMGGPLTIASVNTIECRQLTEYSRQLTFTPVYSGGDGSPITFQIQNESLPTTAGGPYSLRVYTDNSSLTLLASQAGSPQVRYTYNWLAACEAARTRQSAEITDGARYLKLSVQAYPNPVLDAVTVQVESARVGDITFEVVDMQGSTRQSRTEYLPEGVNKVEFRLGSLPGGVYLMRAVDALGQQATVKISKQ